MQTSRVRLYGTILRLVLLFVFTGHMIIAQPPDNPAQNERGIYVIDVENKNDISLPITPVNEQVFNTRDTFNDLFINNTVALLIGNDRYESKSGYEPLNQCANDVRVVSRLLTTCCNVRTNNINAYTDLTAAGFRRIFTHVTNGLKPGQAFIFMYSGHGDKDGALVFTDGERVPPEELKTLINSVDNDTVMILDACYSGNNEGPINYDPDHRFKDNCLRIYSSLAHLSAKEISYDNDYFDDIQEFYEGVLGLTGDNAVDGNGYFTSFIGYFFAEYRVSDYPRVTFNDLFRYISNKSKEYVEHLALRSNEDREHYRAAYSKELVLRLNQHPKMLPYDRDVVFKNPRHKNLVMRINRPNALTVELSVGPTLYLGMLESTGHISLLQYPVSISNVIRLSYGPDILKGVFFGMETGYTFFYDRAKDTIENNRDSGTDHYIPVVGIVGYRHDFIQTNEILGIKADIGAGISYSYSTKRKSNHIINTKFQTNVGVVIQPVKNLSLSCDVQFYVLTGSPNDNALINTVILGMQFPVAVSYKF